MFFQFFLLVSYQIVKYWNKIQSLDTDVSHNYFHLLTSFSQLRHARSKLMKLHLWILFKYIEPTFILYLRINYIYIYISIRTSYIIIFAIVLLSYKHSMETWHSSTSEKKSEDIIKLPIWILPMDGRSKKQLGFWL